MYISIDGDDVGRLISGCYLRNDVKGLSDISDDLKRSTENISSFLCSIGFDIVFCAADGVVASCGMNVDFEEIFEGVRKLSPVGITYSAGVGASLKESYIALLFAKSNGKDKIQFYSEV